MTRLAIESQSQKPFIPGAKGFHEFQTPIYFGFPNTSGILFLLTTYLRPTYDLLTININTFL